MMYALAVRWTHRPKLAATTKSLLLVTRDHTTNCSVTGNTNRVHYWKRVVKYLSRNTNKMQLCNRIYYSKVYWRLNIFPAAHRSSSGALNCICSLWFIYPCVDRPLPKLSGRCLGYGRSPHGYINQRLQIQFRAPDDERCAARNMLSLE